jgi:branched-chain amino acid transport system substrate-binding protein
MKGHGVDTLMFASNAPTIQHVVADCAQQGYKPTVVGIINSFTNQNVTDPNLNGMLLTGINANVFDPSRPAVAQFQAAMNKVAPGYLTSSAAASDTIFGWAGGMLFEAAAKAGNVGPNSTPADVKKGLYALHDETLGGLAPPLTFTPGKPTFVPCYFAATVTSGKFVSLYGNKPICLTGAEKATLSKTLQVG